MLEGARCDRPTIKPGGVIPAEWGGGVSKFGWEIPLIAKNVATKPELVGHFAVEAPDFNVHVPDQMEQARTREIQSELRRREGERTRPQGELDYIGRLLKAY